MKADVLQSTYLHADETPIKVFAKWPGITLIHCMAHARRMFHDALDNNIKLAEHALKQIQVLYAIERRCREQALNFAEIKEIRQSESLPVLQCLGAWMRRST